MFIKAHIYFDAIALQYSSLPLWPRSSLGSRPRRRDHSVAAPIRSPARLLSWPPPACRNSSYPPTQKRYLSEKTFPSDRKWTENSKKRTETRP